MTKAIAIYRAAVNSKHQIIGPFCHFVRAVKFLNIFFKHLMTHFVANKFISGQQHNFTCGFSMVTQLLHTASRFPKFLIREARWASFFWTLEFAKAFDQVSHRKIRKKREKLGVNLDNEGLVLWLHSCLNKCYQFVEVGGLPLPTAPVISHIPQGSVLGPLLLLAATFSACFMQMTVHFSQQSFPVLLKQTYVPI